MPNNIDKINTSIEKALEEQIEIYKKLNALVETQLADQIALTVLLEDRAVIHERLVEALTEENAELKTMLAERDETIQNLHWKLL